MKKAELITWATIILNCAYFLSFGQNVNVTDQSLLLKVSDSNPPAKLNVLSATVVSDNSTYIIWEPSKASDFAFYKVYRQNASTGNYILVKTISDVSSTGFSDDSLNTLANSYCYKIQTVDSSGYAISIDSLQEHCTINVTTKGVKGGIQVNWNSYIGASVDSYSIYRVEAKKNAQVLIAKVPSEVLTILDTNIYYGLGFSYRIKANKLNGHFISSSSDTSTAKPIVEMLSNSQNNLLRSTVLNSNAVLTKWETPIGSLKTIAEYVIYKSNDNVNFSFLATVPSAEYRYIDNGADGSSKNFYRIETKDNFGVTTKGGKANVSILLKVKSLDGNILLSWIKYEGSNQGIRYSINDKMDENESLGSIEKAEEGTSF